MTLQEELILTARSHLERGTTDAYDMCAVSGQQLDNIRHTETAVRRMANWLIANRPRYARLLPL